MFPRGQSCYLQFVMSCFFFSFYSPYVILLKICPINYFKISHGKPELPTSIINIITSKPRGPYLPLFYGRKTSGLGGCVYSVEFGTPFQRQSV